MSHEGTHLPALSFLCMTGRAHVVPEKGSVLAQGLECHWWSLMTRAEKTFSLPTASFPSH